jgi:hypothetical protein
MDSGDLLWPVWNCSEYEAGTDLEAQALVRGSFSAIRNFLPQCVHVAVENKMVFPGQLCRVGFRQCGHLIGCRSRARSMTSASDMGTPFQCA